MVDIQGVPSGEVDGSGIKLHLTDPQAGQMYSIIYILWASISIHVTHVTVCSSGFKAGGRPLAAPV